MSGAEEAIRRFADACTRIARWLSVATPAVAAMSRAIREDADADRARVMKARERPAPATVQPFGGAHRARPGDDDADAAWQEILDRAKR